MIRTKVIRDINSTIGIHPNFNEMDFKVEMKKSNVRGVLSTILITYEYKEEYFFKIIVPEVKVRITKKDVVTSLMNIGSVDKDYDVWAYEITKCPGSFTLKEVDVVHSTDEILKQISQWLDYLWEELLSIPIVRELEFQKNEIEKIKGRLENIQDLPFTKDEAENLKSRLDNLEAKFAEKFTQNELSEEDLQSKITELHNEIEGLKSTIFSLNKKGWFKSFISKTFTWLSKEENRKMLKDGTELIRPMLPDEIKGVLPETIL